MSQCVSMSQCAKIHAIKIYTIITKENHAGRARYVNNYFGTDTNLELREIELFSLSVKSAARYVSN